jgi:DnaJ-class molecular chaperone
MSNYYEVLGVPNDASEEQIKRAYRKLSLQYHPDRNTDPSASARFQAINEANEVLSDAGRRAQYDGGGADLQANVQFHDINEIFNTFFGGMGGGGMMGPDIRFFHQGMPGGSNFFQHLNKPMPIVKNLKLTMEQAYFGGSFPVDIERWNMVNNQRTDERQTLYVTIPPGIDENEVIILSNIGNTINNTSKGDVKICIHIENETEFKRHGLDLIYKKTVSLKEALCGFDFEIKHVNKKTLAFKNVANAFIIKPGFKKVVPEFGFKRENTTGNLVIEFDILFPDQLTAEQIKVLSETLL